LTWPIVVLTIETDRYHAVVAIAQTRGGSTVIVLDILNSSSPLPDYRSDRR